jgi:hypothetical protein
LRPAGPLRGSASQPSGTTRADSLLDT